MDKCLDGQTDRHIQKTICRYMDAWTIIRSTSRYIARQVHAHNFSVWQLICILARGLYQISGAGDHMRSCWMPPLESAKTAKGIVQNGSANPQSPKNQKRANSFNPRSGLGGWPLNRIGAASKLFVRTHVPNLRIC